MDSESNIVDLTLSDNDDVSPDDTKLLSLQERILLLENKEQHLKMSGPVPTSPAKKRLHSSSDSDKSDVNITEVKTKNDGNWYEELPDVVDIEKENAKLEKIRLREQKKQEKELAKALKASEKEMQKSKKPDELLKGMKILIDQSIIFENESEDIFCALDDSNLKYNIEENSVNMSVMWCRTIVDVVVENNEVIKMEKEQVENVLVLVISNENFSKMVHAFVEKSKGKSSDETTLLDHITNIKSVFPHLDITCVVVGLDKYLRSVKENDMCSIDVKKRVRQVSKTAIEEATIEVQIQSFVNFNFLNTMREFGELLARFSKAIAEAPQRKEKHAQKCLAFSWYADADSSCPVKIGKDGSGFMKLWQQQIQQFHNVGPEVAEAITSKYPSPQILVQAYKACRSSEAAEKLLQDIVVRRNYGPLGTQRRIGPELSYKIHLFYSSRDGNQILQR
ncbi:crossover junction endonuclease EME1 [Nephila pilipes]|uniref:Crossover junction endonuclease EME1 n=1 Tax=Nephila pilipes TaxID=299642 RepID=A0A8X6QED1_NEPPI|nr:crossover junction endonuclease EME1 [Nephila pilipes]GFT50583.1 crossover junction endonuclease EME1 [Nephila pilipes]GFU14110.1 crossover junction endonuclease EME1 [Nephila pilipes]GFU14508.1 crossover junction endonuclease EME1 [Nephila pilipes]